MSILDQLKSWFSPRSTSDKGTAKPLPPRRLAGNEGEDHAAALLKKRGDKVVERNWSCRSGELDLVTWNKDTLVFVEVRTRASTQFGTPAETVDRKKQEKLRRTANAFLSARFRDGRVPNCRYDVVWIVAKDGVISDSGIIEGAFV